MARVVSQRADMADAAPWPVPLREFSVDGYIAVALVTGTDVREEWCAMRNCVLDYIAGCEEGTHRIVSLRDRETGERVVSIVLKRERGRYVAIDARRRFNRPAGPELWSVAERAAAIYGAACDTPTRWGTTHRRRMTGERPRSSELLTGPQAAFDFCSA